MLEALMMRAMDRVMHDRGTLTTRLPSGAVHTAGSGAPHVTLAIRDPAVLRAVARNVHIGLGDAYMDGTMTLTSDARDPDDPCGPIRDLFRVFARSKRSGALPPVMQTSFATRAATRRWMQRNAPGRARRNVAHHYDLGDAFYDLWLDDDRQYSCAYFPRPGMTLEEAQVSKKRHVARKLRLEPGMRVLDVGCGWGGLALTLAGEFGARVTGVTLSENQAATARRRAAEAGLSDRVDIRLQDYRDVDERFDRVVSVGMLEHVGAPNYPAYFAAVDRLLGPDGVALIHTIARCQPPQGSPSWVGKWIFPGGYNPSLSEVAAAVERTGLWWADVESLRGHYAETLRRWQSRFEDALPQVRAMYDERFVRMWRWYLVGSEVAFDDFDHVVLQIQLAKHRGAVPATRAYLHGGGAETGIPDRAP